MDGANVTRDFAAAGSMLSSAEELRSRSYSFVPAARMQAAFPMDEQAWRSFAACWDNLTLDRYMGDGGVYRFRRYGAFELSTPDAPLRLLPHAAYVQPSYINTLNGDVVRWFDALEPAFTAHPFLQQLLRVLGRIFDEARGSTGPWNIRLHPYRIRAWPGASGKPTPEGLHRDGVDYIVTLLVERHNIRGGLSSVAARDGHSLFERVLEQPMDMLLGDDQTSMHAVTPIECADTNTESYRDVLVIAFTACELPGQLAPDLNAVP